MRDKRSKPLQGYCPAVPFSQGVCAKEKVAKKRAKTGNIFFIGFKIRFKSG